MQRWGSWLNGATTKKGLKALNISSVHEQQKKGAYVVQDKRTMISTHADVSLGIFQIPSLRYESDLRRIVNYVKKRPTSSFLYCYGTFPQTTKFGIIIGLNQ